MALHRFAIALVHPLAILVQPQAAQNAHRDGLVRRLQSHDAKELLGPLNHVGRDIDIPDADPSQFFGHPEQRIPLRQFLPQSPAVANVSHEYHEPAGTRIDVHLDWRAGDERDRFELPPLAGLQRVRQQTVFDRSGQLRESLEDVLSQKVGALARPQSLCSFIQVGDAPIGVDADTSVCQRLEDLGCRSNRCTLYRTHFVASVSRLERPKSPRYNKISVSE